jgi:hypothetical protein
MKDDNDNDKNLDHLLATARKFRPDTSFLENQFEKRLMARIQEKRSFLSTWFFWELRLVSVCAILVLIVGTITLITDAHRSQDIMLYIAEDQENQFIARHLTGD